MTGCAVSSRNIVSVAEEGAVEKVWPQFDPNNIFHKDLVPDSKHSPLKHHKDVNYYSVENESGIEKTTGYDYVDRDIVFMNHHCDKLCVAFSSDYELCQEANQDSKATTKMLYWAKKVIPFEEYSAEDVEYCMDYYANKWPMIHRLRELFNEHHINFLTSVARISAPHRFLSRDQLTVFHKAANLFGFDNVGEIVANMEDRSAWYKFKHNADVVLGQKEGTLYDLRHVDGFPKDLVEMGILAIDLFQDMVETHEKYAPPGVPDWFRKSCAHYVKGVGDSYFYNQLIQKNDVKGMTEKQFIKGRGGSVAGIVSNSMAATSFCCKFLDVEDPYIQLVDLAAGVETDASTFFKEQFEPDRKTARDTYRSTNIMDYLRLAKGMDLNEAIGRNYASRNKMVRILEQKATQLRELPFTEPRHAIRYERTARQIMVGADYSFLLGNNMPNMRYGWYATTKAKAAAIIEKSNSPVPVVEN